MYSMIVHDRRLKGNAPRIGGVIDYDVDGSTGITQMLSTLAWVVQRYGRLARLSIMCHGYEDKQGHGGYGLQLCREGVHQNNVQLWNKIYKSVNWLFVYSCAAADVAPGDQGKEGDGQLLCRRLAFYTGAYVRAGAATQYYQYVGTGGGIDFGRWEGWVYTFAPNGTVLSPQYQPND